MRKESTMTLADGGQQLTFKLRQFPATQQERWLNRLVFLLAKGARESALFGGGQDARNDKGGLPKLDFSDFERMKAFFKKEGPAGLLKILGGLAYEDVEPLYEELMTCAKIARDNFEQDCTKAALDSAVEDVATLYFLRLEILKLNFGFFLGGGNSPKEAPPDIKI